jgi:8-oxo-dGTP diphosphatase
MNRRFATTPEAARALGIPVTTLQGWAKEGVVKPAWRTPGGHYRWDVDALERELYGRPEGHTTDPGTPIRQPSVAAIITSRKGVLITRRLDGQPLWGFPSGEIWHGESPEDASIRETKEETGLEVKVSHVIGERDHPRTGRHMIYVAARPAQGTAVHVGDEDELAEVVWVDLATAVERMPDMFGPAREHLERTLKP